MTGASQITVLNAQRAFTGNHWLLEWGPDCIVSLDSKKTVEQLQLSTADYQELLGNFRMVKCRDALCDEKIRSDVYSKTAGQVCSSLLHPDTLRWPQWYVQHSKQTVPWLPSSRHCQKAEQDSCGLQAGLITELLDVTTKHLEGKPFEPGAFDRTIR